MLFLFGLVTIYVLFTNDTKNLKMVSATAKNKTLKQKCFCSCQNDVKKLLTVTDGALKFDCTSVIFVDRRVKSTNSASIVLPHCCALHKVSCRP